MRSILERMNDRADLHPRGERLRNPALTSQASRSTHFDGPLLFHAGLVLDNHQDPAVRVRPLEFLHRAVELNGFFRVEHRERMVGQSRNRIHRNGDACEAKDFESHVRLQFAFLLPY